MLNINVLKEPVAATKEQMDKNIEIINEFFDRFIDVTETRYMVWKGTDIKAGGLAGEIVSFWMKKLNENND